MPVLFAADGRTPLGVATNSGADLTEFFPMVKPMPKNKAHKITSPKNSMSILPVPNVISVSVSGSNCATLAGLIEIVKLENVGIEKLKTGKASGLQLPDYPITRLSNV